MKLLFTAAHHGFALDRVPLGGGAAVCARLLREWEKTCPFEIEVLGPSILGKDAPQEKDLVRYSEWEYARFCLRFEEALTARILAEDPAAVAVLSNDVSEGPSFRRLGKKGYRIFTIYHVDVVDYIATTYLKKRLRPETLTRFFKAVDSPWLRALLPDIAALIFSKQQDSVEYSRGLIVPSRTMKDVLRKCYPSVDPAQIHVTPWGVQSEEPAENDVESEVKRWRQILNLPGGMPVLLTLSRISPEKRQDRLLEALRWWENRAGYPATGICLLIAGEAAFMQGARFERELRRRAALLRKTKVVFCGFAAGASKAALFRLADLYVFPSEHESYGLTLLEAMRAGLPSVACFSHGAKEVLREERGVLLPPIPDRKIPEALSRAIARLLGDPAFRRQMGIAAQTFARTQRFEDRAVELADLLRGGRTAREPVGK
jgi:glycosyltransferase involved in cell wall biosynthesis